MKRIITILMVTTMVAGAAFARGSNEESNGTGQGSGLRAETETVLISGTVEEHDGQIVLNSGGELYSLSAPGFYRAGVEVPFGETVEVSGSMTKEPCDDCEINADGHIFVASASVGGEEVSFDTGRGNERSGDRQSGNRQGSGSQDGSGRKGSGRNSGSRGGNRQDGNRQGGGSRTETS